MAKEPHVDLLERIRSGYRLPHLSTVATKLVELASDDTCSAKDLAALIEKDPSLALRVLTMANSAFYGPAGPPIASLSQAVVRLGFHQLRIMALSLSLRYTFPLGKVGVLNYEEFWRTSLYRALVTRALVSQLKQGDPDEAFFAGLAMEIGLLILFDLRIKGDKEARPLALEPLEDLLSWERGRYGIDHRQIGEAALRYWRLPEHVVVCQRFYGAAALAPEAPLLARVYEFSREFSRVLTDKSARFHTLFSEARRRFGLDQEVILDTVWATFEQVEETGRQLRLELDREKDLLEIMEKANRALSRISALMAKAPGAVPERPRPSLEALDTDEGAVAHTLQAVAHEIRNPLMVIGGFARRLSTNLDPETKGGQYAQVILDEAARLEKLLAEMTREGRT
jgi:HD-like signal output (HDOD) protein